MVLSVSLSLFGDLIESVTVAALISFVSNESTHSLGVARNTTSKIASPLSAVTSGLSFFRSCQVEIPYLRELSLPIFSSERTFVRSIRFVKE